jgi:hypothetical protein
VAEGGVKEEPVTRKPLYRNRFGLAYVCLSAVVGVAAGAFILLLGKTDAVGTTWSSWQPDGSSGDRVDQITAHVASRYRLPSGRQLVAVFAGPPRLQNVDISRIAVRKPVVLSQNDIDVLSASRSLVYVFCGLGTSCSIPEGAVSQERARLLRHEALELALYTFKYVDEVDSIVTFLPPRPPTKDKQGKQQPGASNGALFFRRNDLKPLLARPLGSTLPRATTPLTSTATTPVPATVDRLTLPRLYRYDLEQGQDGAAILVLDPAVVSS